MAIKIIWYNDSETKIKSDALLSLCLTTANVVNIINLQKVQDSNTYFTDDLSQIFQWLFGGILRWIPLKLR